MDYSKFYTPPAIANLLVRQLKISPPSEIVDICCGGCNLLHAAAKRWTRARLLGVDVMEHTSSDVMCLQLDGREFALNHASQYPLVLANPPFDFAATKNEYPDLYDWISFDYSTSRLEVEMLFANLRLLQEQGTLMIIMPSTFVNGNVYSKIRAYIAKKFYVQKIIHLPDETFGTSKINTCAIVIKKNRIQRCNTNCYNVVIENGEYSISKPTPISQRLIRIGQWDDIPLTDIKSIKFSFRRGNISSQFFCSKGEPVLHTAKINSPWKPSVRYVTRQNKFSTYAETGDIIVSRVGKSAGCWHKYCGSRILISDCLYAIKDPTGAIANKLAGKEYSFPLKGVAARYITMSDFSAWIESV